MKKLLSWFLIFLILFTGISTFAEETEVPTEGVVLDSADTANAEDFSKFIEFSTGLGIIPANDFEGTAYVTRGEFADYICNILFEKSEEKEVDSWFGELFQEDNYNELMVPSTGEGYFDDVSQSHQYYQSIVKVKELLLMNGTGDKIFAPDDCITFGEVAVVMVRLLGYSARAKQYSYPTVAQYLKVFKGMDYQQDVLITKNQMAKVFYNCKDIDLTAVEITSEGRIYSVQKNVNLYSHFMSVYEGKGRVTKTQIASIYGDEPAFKNYVEIDNKSYDALSAGYIENYIGREVQFFYKKDDDLNKNVLLTARCTNNDHVLSIDPKTVDSFVNGKLTYTVDDSAEKIDIPQGAVMIYNGTYKSSYDESNFKLENGDITLIGKGSSSYNYIIVNNYESFVVTSVDSQTRKIHTKSTNDGKIDCIDLDGISDYLVRFSMSDGTKTDIMSVTQGKIIDVCRSNKYYNIIISDNVIDNFYVSYIGTDDDWVLGDADGNEYIIQENYLLSLGSNVPKVDNTYKIYINSFGKIVYIESVKAEKGSNLVYIIYSDSGTRMGDIGQIKFLSAKGLIQTLAIEKNAQIQLSDYTRFRIKKPGDFSRFTKEFYQGPAFVDVGENNTVISITLPVDENQERNNEFGFMGEYDTCWCDSPKFFENVIPSADSTIFNVNRTEIDDKHKYSVIPITSFLDGANYKIKAYNSDSDSVMASCIVIDQDNELESSMTSKTKTLYVVNKVFDAVDEDGLPVSKVEAYKVNTSQDTEKIELTAEQGIFEKAETFFDKNAGIQVKKGDIIHCELFEDKVEKCVVVYSIFNDSGNYDCRLTGTQTVSLMPSMTVANTNPYNMTTKGMPHLASITSLRNHEIRLFGGNIYNCEDNKYITYTSQPINNGMAFDKTNSDDRYLTETVALPSRFVTVTVKGNNITISKGNVTDIKTYKSVGTTCSQALISTRYADIRHLIIVNKLW